MARDILTGTRIRERRVALGLKQARLAEEAGISASYLNLIEHNRRRIGGKLLNAIARILDVEPAVLTEGAEAQVIAVLRDAAEGAEKAAPELDRVDEFAGRFPGWAMLVAEQAGRLASQAQVIDALSDRLAHDPQLAAALHEILSTVTAIRSTAGILAEDPEIAPEWRARFHRNINEEAARLSDSSMELVRYLEADETKGPVTPQEEVDAFLVSAPDKLSSLEAGEDIDLVVREAVEVRTDAGRDMLRAYLRRHLRDAKRLPDELLQSVRAELGDDPAALAARCDAPLDTVLHRLAQQRDAHAGLVICNSVGTITHRRALPNLTLPSLGSSAVLWPLLAAISQPGRPLRRIVTQPGREDRLFETFSIATPVGAPAFDTPPRIEGVMMIRALPEGQPDANPPALPLTAL